MHGLQMPFALRPGALRSETLNPAASEVKLQTAATEVLTEA